MKNTNSETLQYIDLVYKTINSWYEKFAEMTPRLIVGLLVFAFFFFFSTFLSKIAVRIFHRFFPKSEQSNSVTTLISIFRFLILILGTFISLEIMGFSGFLWKFIGSLGVAGVIAGVALKDLVSSIFSGLLVGIDKSFVVGDYVSIGGNSGTVQEIGFLTTKIINDEGKKVYIPNQLIFNSPFINVTASEQRRVILSYDIPADEDIMKAREIVLNTIKSMENVDKIDAVEVNFTDLNQGNFSMQVKFWLLAGSNVVKAKSDALLKIKTELDAAGIQLTSPTSITINNPT